MKDPVLDLILANLFNRFINRQNKFT